MGRYYEYSTTTLVLLNFFNERMKIHALPIGRTITEMNHLVGFICRLSKAFNSLCLATSCFLFGDSGNRFGNTKLVSTLCMRNLEFQNVNYKAVLSCGIT